MGKQVVVCLLPMPKHKRCIVKILSSCDFACAQKITCTLPTFLEG